MTPTDGFSFLVCTVYLEKKDEDMFLDVFIFDGIWWGVTRTNGNKTSGHSQPKSI